MKVQLSFYYISNTIYAIPTQNEVELVYSGWEQSFEAAGKIVLPTYLMVYWPCNFRPIEMEI